MAEGVLIGRGLEAVDIGSSLQKEEGAGVHLQLGRKAGEKRKGTGEKRAGLQANIMGRMVGPRHIFDIALKFVFLPGEDVCEYQNYFRENETLCLSIGCCQFDRDEQLCYSDVGDSPCIRSGSTPAGKLNIPFKMISIFYL